MIVLLAGGCRVLVPHGRAWRETSELIEIVGSGNRVLATFYKSHVCGLFYDNEDITIYGFAGE